jgi:uncharacterized protein (DUF1697 family)
MPDLAVAFEGAGFADVATVRSSGNVLFTSRPAARATLERRAEAGMRARLGKAFPVIVREVEALRALLASDPFAGFRLPARAKRVVTFLRSAPRTAPALPVARDGARILRLVGEEVVSAYLPGPHGPVFMQLIEQTFGKDVTTRTWDTVARVAR